MKKIFITILTFQLVTVAISQTKPKQKPPTQSEMNKQMAEAMKGMSPEEQAK